MVAGEPIVYWQFGSEILGEGIEIVKIVSATGDECHYDICHLPNRQGRSIFKENALNKNLMICIDNTETQFSLEVFERLTILPSDGL
jgi:hypothetical protein